MSRHRWDKANGIRVLFYYRASTPIVWFSTAVAVATNEFFEIPRPTSLKEICIKKEASQTDKRDIAGVAAPPPLIYLAALGVGYYFSRVYPLDLPTTMKMSGWLLIAMGVLCVAWAFHAMGRANTPVDPYQPTTALVTTGPYGFSRNPLYVALTLFYVGSALLLNAPWAILLLPLVLVVMVRGVITREERYLERKFGAAYREYKTHVRRWI